MLKKKIIFYIFILSAVFSFVPNFSLAANFPLEITNIKPAGTGLPAIPATNRIFRAYPGIEYNIRAAVIGGAYPYRYSLTNAPSGMSINATTGEISWPNPQANSGEITLSVSDSESTTVSTTWSITVTTAGFIFVDSNYSGVESGSITQPYSSILNLLNGTTSVNNPDIVYFRGGNYTLVKFGSTARLNIGTNLLNSATTWIGYPGETVNIDGDGRMIATGAVPVLGVYFDSINLSNLVDYGIMTKGGNSYATIRRCSFSGLTVSSSVNDNMGFFYTSHSGDGYYLVIQDSEFSNFTGASAIGSLYYTKKALIEDNHIFGSGGGGVSAINNGIAAKYHTDYLTVRGNRIEMNSGVPFGSSLNAAFSGADSVEINFNLFVRSTIVGERGLAHNFNGDGWYAEGSQKTLYYHRNTVVGDINFMFINGLSCANSGPYYFYDNVIINPNLTWGSHYYTTDYFSFNWGTDMNNNPKACVVDTNNLKGGEADNIIDANGNFTAGYYQYVGSAGWQLSNDAVAPNKPSGMMVE